VSWLLLRCRLTFPSLVCTEDSNPLRKLAKLGQRARERKVVAPRFDVDVEQIFPRPAADRPAFQLAQVDVAQREDAERLEERSRRTGQREDDRRLVGLG